MKYRQLISRTLCIIDINYFMINYIIIQYIYIYIYNAKLENVFYY